MPRNGAITRFPLCTPCRPAASGGKPPCREGAAGSGPARDRGVARITHLIAQSCASWARASPDPGRRTISWRRLLAMRPGSRGRSGTRLAAGDLEPAALFFRHAFASLPGQVPTGILSARDLQHLGRRRCGVAHSSGAGCSTRWSPCPAAGQDSGDRRCPTGGTCGTPGCGSGPDWGGRSRRRAPASGAEPQPARRRSSFRARPDDRGTPVPHPRLEAAGPAARCRPPRPTPHAPRPGDGGRNAGQSPAPVRFRLARRGPDGEPPDAPGSRDRSHKERCRRSRYRPGWSTNQAARRRRHSR